MHPSRKATDLSFQLEFVVWLNPATPAVNTGSQQAQRAHDLWLAQMAAPQPSVEAGAVNL